MRLNVMSDYKHSQKALFFKYMASKIPFHKFSWPFEIKKKKWSILYYYKIFGHYSC